jgi:hypothetical protein
VHRDVHVTVHRDVHVTVHRDKFHYNKTNQMHLFLKFILEMKLYMFPTVPMSIIRSYSLYTQQWYMSYRFVDNFRAGSRGWVGPKCLLGLKPAARKLSTNLCDIYHCNVYGEIFVMMDKGIVRNM